MGTHLLGPAQSRLTYHIRLSSFPFRNRSGRAELTTLASKLDRATVFGRSSVLMRRCVNLGHSHHPVNRMRRRCPPRPRRSLRCGVPFSYSYSSRHLAVAFDELVSRFYKYVRVLTLVSFPLTLCRPALLLPPCSAPLFQFRLPLNPIWSRCTACSDSKCKP
jgi:hypothetical protein